LQRRDDAVMDIRGESSQIFFRSALKQDAVHNLLSAALSKVIL